MSTARIPMSALLIAALSLGTPVPGLCAKQPPASTPLVAGKTDAATLLPNVSPDKIYDHWQNPRYGVIIGTNGEVLLVYSPGGEALFNVQSWYLQGQSAGADGKPVFTYLGSGDYPNVPIDLGVTREGYRLYEIKDATTDYLRWSKRIICKPNALRIELEFTPLKAPPAGVKPNLSSLIKILAKTAQPFAQPNANPINVLTYSYSFDIQYDPQFSWYQGYYIDGDTIFFSPLYGKPFAVGVPCTLEYEVNF